jgi:hypothetical protein
MVCKFPIKFFRLTKEIKSLGPLSKCIYMKGILAYAANLLIKSICKT